MCWERRPQPCPRPRSSRGPLAPPAAAPDWLQEGDRGRWSARPRRTPPPQHAPPVSSLPSPLTPHRRSRSAEESAPTWNRVEEQQEQKRAEQQHPRRPRPGEGSQRRRHSAGLRGHALRPLRSRCPPAGPRLRRSPRRGWTRAAWASRSRTGVLGAARRALVSVVAARPAHGHRLAGGGGPESPVWGRSEAAAGEGGGGGVDSAAAACLGTTFYIWPLVWGPRGRRGWRRETLGGGRLRPGRGPGGGGKEGAGPTGQCTWGSSPG